MRIRSIIEMDNGMKYCLPLDLAEVASVQTELLSGPKKVEDK